MHSKSKQRDRSVTKLTRWSERGSDEAGWCVEITFDGVEYIHQGAGSVHDVRRDVLRMVAAYYQSQIPVPNFVTAERFIYSINHAQGWKEDEED